MSPRTTRSVRSTMKAPGSWFGIVGCRLRGVVMGGAESPKVYGKPVRRARPFGARDHQMRWIG